MNILYVAAEVAPFIKTGGLADVAGALPKALNRIGEDCRVVLPLHGLIPSSYTEKLRRIAEFWIDLGWKHEYCGVYELIRDGVTVYFLDNKYYFNRSRLYGEWDDAERFIFFSKAAVQLPKVVGFAVDVIHANDWHSAMVPVYVNDYRTGDTFYRDVRTLFSIHNLKYQGSFGLETFYWTNLSSRYLSDYDLKFYNSLNMMKGAIVHATKVNTVSKTYAEEIRYPFFGEGLEGVIQAYAGKLSGIVNGIDTEVWNPATDALLEAPFDVKTRERRALNKRALQAKYGLPVDEHIPMLAMVSRLTAMKGLDLIRYILDELLQEQIQLVVLGTGDPEYEALFREFEHRYPDRMAARIYYSNEEAHQIYGSADLFLMPSVSEPCGLSQMIAMRYGAVPIVREAGGLRDTVESYNRYEHSGDGFSFQTINAHDLLFTIKRALTVYREQPDEFRLIQHNGMVKDLSWGTASRAYQALYRSLF